MLFNPRIHRSCGIHIQGRLFEPFSVCSLAKHACRLVTLSDNLQVVFINVLYHLGLSYCILRTSVVHGCVVVEAAVDVCGYCISLFVYNGLCNTAIFF